MSNSCFEAEGDSLDCVLSGYITLAHVSHGGQNNSCEIRTWLINVGATDENTEPRAQCNNLVSQG